MKGGSQGGAKEVLYDKDGAVGKQGFNGWSNLFCSQLYYYMWPSVVSLTCTFSNPMRHFGAILTVFQNNPAVKPQLAPAFHPVFSIKIAEQDIE